MAVKQARKPALPPLTDTAYHKMFKMLREFEDFSFRKPVGNKPFKTQQKSAIRRKWIKYGHLIRQVAKGKKTYIKYKTTKSGRKIKFSGVQGIRTQKGIILPYEDAKIVGKRDKRGVMRYQVEANDRGAIMRTFYFPDDIIGNIELIQDFVDELVRIYNPDSIRTLINNSKSQSLFSPDAFNLYLSGDIKGIGDKEAQPDFMEGVGLEFFTDKNQFEKAEKKEAARIRKLKKKNKK